MAKTQTKSPDDPSMWRRLLRVVHPDTHGDEELFVWVSSLRDQVTGAKVSTPTPQKYDIILRDVNWNIEDNRIATRQQLDSIGTLYGLNQKERYTWYNIGKTRVNRLAAKDLIERKKG